MPKDTRPSEPSSISFRGIAAHAHALNTLTDNLRTSIDSVDVALRKLNVGITTWVRLRLHTTQPTEDFEVFEQLELGYAKVNGTWGIAIRQSSGPTDDPDNIIEREWLFNDAPRLLRLEAIDGLPSLFHQIGRDLQELGERIFEKVKVANAFAKDIMASAEELGFVEENAASRKDDQR